MKTHPNSLMRFACLSLLLGGCDESSHQVPGERPAAPHSENANTSVEKKAVKGDIIFEFKGFVSEDPQKGRSAKFTIKNTYQRGAKKLTLLLNFKDGEGNVIKTIGSSVAASSTLVGPGESIERLLGFNIPAEAATVEVEELQDIVWDDEKVIDFSREE